MTMSPSSYPVALVAGATQVIKAQPTRYKGISIRETAGGASVFRLWDNAAAASGTIVKTINLAANASYNEYLPDGGLQCVNGVFLERVSGGAFEGSVHLG